MERLKNRKKNNMKVMVSKVMERELNKFFKDKPPFNKYSFEYGECSVEEYNFHIGDPMDNEVDWLYEKSKFKFIEVIYPEEYYAMPTYITTTMLLRCFRHSNKTLESFMKQVEMEVEI